MSEIWARLVQLQKDVYELKMRQYRFGDWLQGCATAAGLRPQAMVTLYSDVLGRELFLALGKDQVQAGGSEEDRRKFIETTVNLLDQGGRVSKHAGVLFEKNKSRSDRVSEGFSSVVNEFGGPAMFAVGAASLTGNIWAGFKELRKTMTASDKQKLDAVVKANVSELTEFKDKPPEEVVRLLALKYSQLLGERAMLLAFLNTTANEPTDPAKDKTELAEIAKKLSDYSVSDDDVPKALISWLATSLQSVKATLGSSKGPWKKPQLDDTQAKVQEIIEAVKKGCVDKVHPEGQESAIKELHKELNKPEDPKQIEKLKVLLNTKSDKVSLDLLTAFMQESYTLRYVLQELLKPQSQSK